MDHLYFACTYCRVNVCNSESKQFCNKNMHTCTCCTLKCSKFFFLSFKHIFEFFILFLKFSYFYCVLQVFFVLLGCLLSAVHCCYFSAVFSLSFFFHLSSNLYNFLLHSLSFLLNLYSLSSTS